ncbi:hypothetical protein KC921_02820 [Candidatus Woesebacteria bacterium]|nr:hypothetical protein [Candidatus Woesebacteria bacterium]
MKVTISKDIWELLERYGGTRKVMDDIATLESGEYVAQAQLAIDGMTVQIYERSAKNIRLRRTIQITYEG